MFFYFTVFKSAPPVPPSRAQIAQKENEKSFSHSMKKLLLNRGYILLLISYGIMVGVFYAISTLLNQVILDHFPASKSKKLVLPVTCNLLCRLFFFYLFMFYIENVCFIFSSSASKTFSMSILRVYTYIYICI